MAPEQAPEKRSSMTRLIGNAIKSTINTSIGNKYSRKYYIIDFKIGTITIKK